jgi:hypothetical protein
MSDHDADIARAAALTVQIKAVDAIAACVVGGENSHWLRGLQAAFEAVAALPLPGDAP